MRALALVIVLVGCRTEHAPVPARAVASASASAAPAASASASAAPAGFAPDSKSDWCIDGMRSLDEDVCYVLPEGHATNLLVYLHGIVPPTKDSVQKQTVQGVVLAAARRAGAAAIVPRGRRGIGPEGARDWWAWPTAPAAHAQLVKEIVARWVEMKKKLETVAGAPFAKTFLAGSSNGAYFIAALALRGDCDDLGFPIDGYGILSGGAPGGRGADALKGRAPRPVYVGYGTYDAETKNGAKAIAAVFEAAHWPVKLAEHPFGHGAREVYLDEAFAFWNK